MPHTEAQYHFESCPTLPSCKSSVYCLQLQRFPRGGPTVPKAKPTKLLSTMMIMLFAVGMVFAFLGVALVYLGVEGNIKFVLFGHSH